MKGIIIGLDLEFDTDHIKSEDNIIQNYKDIGYYEDRYHMVSIIENTV